MPLTQFFHAHPRVALAFSGGVDSAYLLYAAQAAGAQVTAYYVKNEFQPAFELEDARKLAAQLGAKLVVLERSALCDETVVSNPKNRCYFCKRVIFSQILAAAKADGFDTVLDGTNASDDADDRPGMQALSELQVLSPLRLCGVTKAEIRRLSKEAGLFTWDKPAYACLATRVPTGMAITAALLSNVEQAEGYLFAQGFTDFRVRITEDGAKLQLPAEQMPRLLDMREAVLEQLTTWFATVTLDLRSR